MPGCRSPIKNYLIGFSGRNKILQGICGSRKQGVILGV
jgi:hypothetical protein